MMVGKEDLAFSLSLSLGPLHHPPRHNFPNVTPRTCAAADVESTGRRPIDVNRAPAAADREREEDLLPQAAAVRAGSSSPSAASSSGGGKRDSETERACSRGPLSDEEVDADGSRKKLRLSKDQSVVLEESFKEHTTLNPKEKLALAKQLKLRPRQVEVWFQNRRARTKLKQTEVDCELLKRCCESLTEENRRLQKEVQELRALKIVSPQLYTHVTPPTTLTMCPSCQRISSSSSNSSSAHPDHHHHHHHRPMPQMGGASRSTPWAPIPLRPPSFSQKLS